MHPDGLASQHHCLVADCFVSEATALSLSVLVCRMGIMNTLPQGGWEDINEAWKVPPNCTWSIAGAHRMEIHGAVVRCWHILAQERPKDEIASWAWVHRKWVLEMDHYCA